MKKQVITTVLGLALSLGLSNVVAQQDPKQGGQKQAQGPAQQQGGQNQAQGAAQKQEGQGDEGQQLGHKITITNHFYSSAKDDLDNKQSASNGSSDPKKMDAQGNNSNNSAQSNNSTGVSN